MAAHQAFVYENDSAHQGDGLKRRKKHKIHLLTKLWWQHLQCQLSTNV